MTTDTIAIMSDADLIEATAAVARDERRITARLLALLAEFDARRLYLGEGCSSLFTYCTQVLHFSEHAAYHRIETARAARYFPLILELIADGSVTTTSVALLRPHLTLNNHATLLAAARHKTKREVEHQIASLRPKPDAAPLVRRLPESRPATADDADTPLAQQVDTSPVTSPPSSPSGLSVPRPKVEALSSERYLLRITLDALAHADLRRAQTLMTHAHPPPDAAAVVARSLKLLVADLERRKAALTERPRKPTPGSPAGGSRRIPAPVRRAVWTRDGGRCAFVGSQGRCAETSRLDFHHVVPFARGGPATLENIALRCRAHNHYEAEQCFGPWEIKPSGPSAAKHV